MINFLLKKLKGEHYTLDKHMTSLDIFLVLLDRFFMLLRGGVLRISIKGKGLLFVGRNVKILHKYKLILGKNSTIKANSTIIGLVKFNIRTGNNFTLGNNSIIEGYGVLSDIGDSLEVGDNVGIGANSFIAIRGKIKIGSNTIIGPGLKIHSESHNYSDKNILIRKQGVNRIGVTIGSDCWIGSNVTILDGVTISDGAIIGSNSLVNKNVGEYEVHFGSPAKLFKKRDK
jgi:acetyltransferase-like isoleucine patch superfamily enzyme